MLNCWSDDVEIGVVHAKSADVMPTTMDRVTSEGRRSVSVGEVA